MENLLRSIPKMDDFLMDPEILNFKGKLSDKMVLGVLQEEIQVLRDRIKSGGFTNGDKTIMFLYVKQNSLKRLNARKDDCLKRVVNASGIVIHTNLGRAPLSKAAMDKVSEVVTHYNNLEYSVNDGKRRSRMFYVEELLKELTGAEAALVVNNNAAAVFLALNSLCVSKEVIVSRGEIVEIGDSFRISEIIQQSGCLIREVGTTNKTKQSDFEQTVTENTAMFLKVHTSNFKIIGFTEEVSSQMLVKCASPKNIMVMEDMGSGVLTDLSRYGFKAERTAANAVADGVDIVTFSGDKMLGGPQAGIIVGKKEYIDKMKKNQMLRCLRIDKMCLVALEATLKQYFSDEFTNAPVMQSLLASSETVWAKAKKMQKMLKLPAVSAVIDEHEAMCGGGALPGETIKSAALYITVAGQSAANIDQFLRSQKIPIISTIQNNQVILDMRTVDEEDFRYIADCFKELSAKSQQALKSSD